jgi:hypothetical protein
MITWLRLLATVLLAAGFGVAGYAGMRAAGDVAFTEAATALARHPEHMMFQAEYYVAATRHYGLIGIAVAAGVGGVVCASLALGIAAILQRLGKSS